MTRKLYKKITLLLLPFLFLMTSLPARASFLEPNATVFQLTPEMTHALKLLAYQTLPMQAGAIYLAKGSDPSARDFAGLVILASAYSTASETMGLMKQRTGEALAGVGTAAILIIPSAFLHYGHRDNPTLNTIATMELAATAYSASMSIKHLIGDSIPIAATAATGLIPVFIANLDPLPKDPSFALRLGISSAICSVYVIRECVQKELENIWPTLGAQSATALLLGSAGALATALTSPGTLTHIVAQTLVEAGAFTAVAPVLDVADYALEQSDNSYRLGAIAKNTLLMSSGFVFSRLASWPKGSTFPWLHSLYVPLATACFLNPAFDLLSVTKSYFIKA